MYVDKWRGSHVVFSFHWIGGFTSVAMKFCNHY